MSLESLLDSMTPPSSQEPEQDARVGVLTRAGESEDFSRLLSAKKYTGAITVRPVDLKTSFHAFAQQRVSNRGGAYRSLAYSAVFDQFERGVIDFVGERWLDNQPVKPVLCFKSQEPLEEAVFESLCEEVGTTFPELSCNFARNVFVLELNRARDSALAQQHEYRMIWNVGKHFESMTAWITYLRPWAKRMEYWNVDRNALQPDGDFLCVGSVYRPEWEREKALYTDDRLMTRKPAFFPAFRDDVQWNASNFRLLFATWLNPNSVPILVEGAARRDFYPVRQHDDPRIRACLEIVQQWNDHPVDLDGPPNKLAGTGRIQFEIHCPGFQGIKCRNCLHPDSMIRCTISKDHIAKFTCLTSRDPRCHGYGVGLTEEAEMWRRWEATFLFLVEKKLNRIDFPITEGVWGGHGLSSRAFYEQFDDFDYDHDYGEHPVPTMAGAVPWHSRIVEEYSQLSMVGELVEYFNLFLCVDLRDSQIIMRGFNPESTFTYHKERAMKTTILKNVKYWYQPPPTPSGKERDPVQKPFWDYWLESQYRSQFQSFAKERFHAPSNFATLAPNLLPPKRTSLTECRAAWTALHENDKAWLRAVWQRAVHCVTALEDQANRQAAKDFFARWFCRVLFCVGEHFAIAVGIYSREGGSGKSSFGDFITKALGTHLTCNKSLADVVGSHFNMDYNVPFINCDDKSAAPDPKRTELLVGQLKNFVTAPLFSGSKKFGNENVNEKKVANIYITTNTEFLGVNSQGHERRMFLQQMLSQAKQQEYFANEGKYVCAFCQPPFPNGASECMHTITNEAKFWKQIWHNDIVNTDHPENGQWFLEFLGMLYEEVHLPFQRENSGPLSVLAPVCRLVTKTQDNMQDLVSIWYNECVARKYIVNPDAWPTKRILLLDKVNPNTIATNWMPVVPFETLWEAYSTWAKGERQRVTKIEFKRQLLEIVSSRAPKNVTVNYEIKGCRIHLRDEGAWTARTYFDSDVLTVYEKAPAARVRASKVTIDRSFRKSTSSLAFGLDSNSPVYLDEEESSRSRFPVSPRPVRKRVGPTGTQVNDVEEESDGEDVGHGYEESLSLSEIENDYDREFINDDEPVLKRARGESEADRFEREIREAQEASIPAELDPAEDDDLLNMMDESD